MEELVRYNEDEFETKYKPIPFREDDGDLTWGDFYKIKNMIEKGELKIEQVWTIVETGEVDDENLYVLPGFHVVNKIDYVVTEVPWEHENIEGVWVDYSQFGDRD